MSLANSARHDGSIDLHSTVIAYGRVIFYYCFFFSFCLHIFLAIHMKTLEFFVGEIEP